MLEEAHCAISTSFLFVKKVQVLAFLKSSNDFVEKVLLAV